jgi:hypothetical protein
VDSDATVPDDETVQQRATLALAALGIGVVALTWATVATSRALPARLPCHLLLWVAAGGAWALALAVVSRLASARAQLPLILAVACVLRVPAWLALPVHSDDIYRYRWDARVQRAGINPYLYAPDAPELATLRDDDWTHINHRQLPSIYPPGAEWAFRAAGSPAAWKLLLALADAAITMTLLTWIQQRGGDPRRVIAWAWSPLVAIEVAENAHVEVLAIALTIAALALAERRRESLAGALLGAAAGVKLLPALLLASLRRRGPATFAALAVALALALPYARAGTHLAGSLGEYGRRWRSNDGAFALIHAAATVGVAHTRFARRYELKPALARAITGRDRDQVYPDEVANLVARVAAGALGLVLFAAALVRRVTGARAAEVLFGSFALLTPVLHPWYVLWLVPLGAVGASPAWMALATLVPFGYRPLDMWLAGGVWHDPVWTRGLIHGTTLVVLAIDRLQASAIIYKFKKRSPWRGRG